MGLKNLPDSASHRTSHRHASVWDCAAPAPQSAHWRPGTSVTVRFGARVHEATVLGELPGRVLVAIHIEGVEEPITTSYTAEELTAAP